MLLLAAPLFDNGSQIASCIVNLEKDFFIAPSQHEHKAMLINLPGLHLINSTIKTM
jgi:hypothetical protein